MCYVFHLRAAKLSFKNIYQTYSFDIFSKLALKLAQHSWSLLYETPKKKKHSDSFNMYCTVSFGFFINRCLSKR